MELPERLYELECSLYYLDIDNFKEKQVGILLRTLLGGRLYDYMRFDKYAHIEFLLEDKKHRYPIVTELDSFNKLKTNCIEFNLTYNTKNNGQFDKLFLYNTIYKAEKGGCFGFFLYNTKTKKCLHKFLIDYPIDNLCYYLNREFNFMYDKCIFEWYANKNKLLDKYKKGDLSVEIPGIESFNKMMKEREERVKIGFYNTQQPDEE